MVLFLYLSIGLSCFIIKNKRKRRGRLFPRCRGTPQKIAHFSSFDAVWSRVCRRRGLGPGGLQRSLWGGSPLKTPQLSGQLAREGFLSSNGHP